MNVNVIDVLKRYAGYIFDNLLMYLKGNLVLFVADIKYNSTFE